MTVIGITGPTGAGKTTVLQALESLGGVLIDADAVYHDLTRSSQAMQAELIARFGPVYDGNELDRKKLGAVVFQDENALADLNRITHACVRREVEKTLSQKPKLAAIDAIALFESGLDSLCNVTVAVTAPEEDRVRRLMTRDAISEDYARSRIAAQHPESWFRERCTHTLENCVIRAPHLLHFTRFGALIFQFARLLSRLALDDLFFGHMDIGYTSLNLLNISLIAAMRGSLGSSLHPQGPSFRFFPQRLQIPLQSSLHKTFKGQHINTSR